MSVDDAYVEQEMEEYYINNFGDSARKELLEDIEEIEKREQKQSKQMEERL